MINFDYCISGNYNIALGKPTEQRPYDFCERRDYSCKQWINGTCSRCSVSGRAVDGNTNPIWFLGSCSHTDTDAMNKGASWSVDLAGLYYLSWINITNSMLKLHSVVLCCCYVNSKDKLLKCS